LTIKDGPRDWQCPVTPKVDFGRSGSIVEKDGTIIEQVIRVPEKIIERTYGPNPDLAVYIAGHIQYNDIFPDTPVHYFEWCVVATPADLKTATFPLIAYTSERVTRLTRCPRRSTDPEYSAAKI
jgi:hypothetical protein